MKNKTLTTLAILTLLVIQPALIFAQGKSQENRGGGNDKAKNVKIEVKDTSEDEDSQRGKPAFTGQKSKVQVEERGRKTILTTEDTFGNETETELDSDEADDVEIEVTEEDESVPEPTPTTKFKVKKNARGGFDVTESKFAAKTNYPLSINSETNELTITTKKGSKVVTVLPDAAIANMLRRGVLDTVDATDSATPNPDDGDDDATGSATPLPGDDASGSGEASESGETAPAIDDAPIILTATDDGTPVYEVKGKKNKRFLGIFPVGISKKVTISAEDGEVIDEEVDGLGNRILNTLSF